MKPRLPKGFTLTELLVVVAIMTSLMGLVLSGGFRRNSADDIRRGAQQFVSMLLSSQSLSLGNPTGAAVIVDSRGTFSETFSQARRYPFIEGDVVQGMPPSDLSAATQTVRLKITNDSDPAVLVQGYKIRFLDRALGTDGPKSEWFSLTVTTTVSTPPTAVVGIRSENGQTSRTALWPTAPASGTMSFQAARYPIPAGFSQALPEGVAIDLRYSGYEGLTNWASLAGKGAIGVGFDTVGTVDAVMQNVLPTAGQVRTVQPIHPYERIYFFVTLRAEIQDPDVNTLASDKALWVVVQPRTGRVTIAPNVPQRSTDPAAVRAARRKAREGIGISG